MQRTKSKDVCVNKRRQMVVQLEIVGPNQCKHEAQLMLTTGSTRLAVSRGQQTWYHSTCYI